MIPPIVHQTWKDGRLPDGLAAYAGTWNRFNPSWRRILWTDRMLLEFVEADYPELLEVYCSYRAPVMRADAARYMLLNRFGGLYADIDAECLAPLTSLENDDRVVLCHEPPAHWPSQIVHRSHPFMLFNGVMASPPGHPFWREILDRLPETRHATEVLDATGPCFLTGVYLGFEPKDGIRVEGCNLFTPTDNEGRESPDYGMPACETLTRHDWVGSWYKKSGKPPRRIRRSLEKQFHRVRLFFDRRPVLTPEAARASVDPRVLGRTPPTGDNVAILVPVRDAIGHIDPFLAAIARLDLPPGKTKLVFCEGDSRDGTAERLEEVVPDLRSRYRDVILLRKNVGTHVIREQRWDRKFQLARRAGIAKVRNHLIDHGLDETDDWALWIDIDVWRFPGDIVQTLKATGGRIVVPHCVTAPGGQTFDMNSFIAHDNFPAHRHGRYILDGLFQAPRSFGRYYLEDFRHSEQVELDGVGGTMILVDASLHRGGLRFPELPYKNVIETEAFGVLARDLGVRAIGLPRVEILHVKA